MCVYTMGVWFMCEPINYAPVYYQRRPLLTMGDGPVQLSDSSLQLSCTHQTPLNRRLYNSIKIDSPRPSHGDIPPHLKKPVGAGETSRQTNRG